MRGLEGMVVIVTGGAEGLGRACVRELGACANYAGSGGAIVGVCRDEAHRERLRDALGAIGCSVVVPFAG